MDILRTLKQLKKIEPDSGYTRRSRSMIVESPVTEQPLWSPWRVLVHGLEFGSAIALTGVFLILVLGGVSLWKNLSPYKLSSLDPASLQAEAEAVDVHFELAKLNYLPAEEPAPSAEAPKAEPEPVKEEVQKKAEDLGLSLSATTSSGTGMDQALDLLSE